MTQQAFIDQLTTLGRQILPKDASLWLYGSRARGDAREDSDWDLLILLNKENLDFTDYGRYAFPLALLGSEMDQELTPQIYTKRQWKNLSFSPFYKNVEQDKKVLLWD